MTIILFGFTLKIFVTLIYKCMRYLNLMFDIVETRTDTLRFLY